jgi:hypothetical protein
LQTEDSEVA